MNNIKKHFLRYEFKYIFDEKIKKELERELCHFMQLDPFVERFENKKYTVRSLYFDDHACTCYHEKIDGLLHRNKFRIRTYATEYDPDIPVCLELKGKFNNFVYKHRTTVDLDKAHSGCIKPILKRLETKPEENVEKQFMHNRFKQNLSPVMLIDYQRRAYQSKYDYEFRVTFDSDLYGTHTSELFPKNDLRKRKLIAGYTIMEVKFRKHVPPWFHRFVLKYQLMRRSISKFCLGMEKSNLIKFAE